MKNRLLIIDGHNLLFQMYFGMPNKIYGKYPFSIHGVIGFIGGLRKIIKAIEPTHLMVIFDGETANFKTEVNPEYKNNRVNYQDVIDDENPFANLPLIQNVLRALNIVSFETINEEADDVIANHALNFNGDIYISSSDSDFLQLVNEHTFVYMYRGLRSVLYDEKKVYERFGVYPKMMAEYKAIVGDTTDNIKGIKGIGKVTAGKLLNHYGSIENIYDHLEELLPRIKLMLQDNRSQINANLSIIKLSKKNITSDYQTMVFNNQILNKTTQQILKELDIL